MRLTISRESMGLFLICLADALLTIAFVGSGRAREANPLMARCLEQGYAFFLLIKMSSTVLVIAVAEMYSRRNPIFVKRLMQVTIVAYVGIYLAMFMVANSV